MVVLPRRPGGQSQFSTYVKYLEVRSRPEKEELQAWILGHPGEDLNVSALADRMGMSPRNFARLFRSETGHCLARRRDADADFVATLAERYPQTLAEAVVGRGQKENSHGFSPYIFRRST
jgi:AraC-like DNA-binding protein